MGPSIDLFYVQSQTASNSLTAISAMKFFGFASDLLDLYVTYEKSSDIQWYSDRSPKVE